MHGNDRRISAFSLPAGRPPQEGEPVGLDLDQTDKDATTAEDAMSEPQLRWRQRLESLQRALGQLEAALQAQDADPESEVIGMAVIKAYEFTFELSWKTLKDLLWHEGLDVQLPREVLRQAFAAGLLRDGKCGSICWSSAT